MFARLLAAAVLFLLASPALAQGVDYSVRFDEVRSQVIEVTMTVRKWDDTRPLEVFLPVWRPGRYAIIDPAGTVRSIKAQDSHAPCRVEQTGKASWRIVDARGDVHVTYTLYANSLNDRTRHADDSHAFLSPSSVFMYVPDRRSDRHEVRLLLPPHWRAATGLECQGDAFIAPNYDVLVDSPIEAGLHVTGHRQVEGVCFEVAAWGWTDWAEGDGPLNMKRLLDDIEKIAREQIRIFGGFPTKRYLFILHIAPGLSGGTEHLNSTVCQARPEAFTDDKAYTRLLRLLAHELFHTWNVKAFRPEGLVPYDYQRENYTRHLWIAEGITDYYDSLTLVRAGLMSEKDYLEDLSRTIRDEMNRPGGRVQSLEGASFEAWTKFNRPTPDSPNATVDFYSRGAITALALDWIIRRESAGRHSLDDVMRLMWERFPNASRAYTDEDFWRCVSDAAGTDLSDFYHMHVRATEFPPIVELAPVVALEWRCRDAKADQPRSRAYIGLRLRDEGQLAAVTHVLSDGPAYGAGVIAGDLIVAMNGRRLQAADLDTRLKALRPGDTLRLTLLRRDELREIMFTPSWRDAAEPALVRVEGPAEAAKLAFRRWLGRKDDSADAPSEEE